ncbi:hypothetical protein N9042_00450 [bacterium]|nr:hypothetical protein [Akkermansiaceae bacterium]MDB4488217.1 hypothetical protein [bacterium]MDB4541905.1 hypothetical protein [bacterium]
MTALSLQAASISITSSPSIVVTDGSSSGITDAINVSGNPEAIESITVEFNLSAASGSSAFLGDLYVYLTNGTDLAVLVNRPGGTSSNQFGYSDNQSMMVLFSQLGLNDIHDYRTPVTGDPSTPLSSTLTGTWQPDSRNTDPSLVLDTDPRTADLSAFVGNPADGTYTLFVADMSSGNVHQLDSWTLNIETVPEVSSFLMVVLGSCGLLLRRCRA